MRILRNLMIPILFLCVLWVVVIFAGPIAIKYYINSMYDNKVKIVGLEISPNLTARARSVEVTDPANRTLVLRGLRFNWSIFSPKPQLEMYSSVMRLNGFFVIQDAKILFSNIFSTNYLDVSAIVKRIKLDDYVSVTDVSLSGQTGWDFEEISDLVINFSSIDYADRLTVSANAFQLKSQQFFLGPEWLKIQQSISLFVNDAKNETFALSLDRFSADVFGSINNFDTSLKSQSLSANRFSVQNLTGKVKFNRFSEAYLNPISLEFSNFYWEDFNFDEILVDIVVQDYRVHGEVRGTLAPSEVVWNDVYYGSFPSFNLVSNFEYEIKNSIVNADMSMSTNSAPVKLSAQINGELIGSDDRNDCLSAICAFNPREASIVLDVDNEIITGQISCQKSQCETDEMLIKVETSNTSNLFSKITELKFLSPVVTLAAYAQITSGEKIGLGNRILLPTQ